MVSSKRAVVLGLSIWAVALAGCEAEGQPPDQGPAAQQPAQPILAANAEDPTRAEAENLDTAFRDHLAALKDVEAILEQMFEDPEKGLPSGTLDELSRRVIETHQQLIVLLLRLPPPTPPPGFSHEPLAIEKVMLQYHNEMLELSDRVAIQLKKAAMLSGTDTEKLLALAAQLEGKPVSLQPTASP